MYDFRVCRGECRPQEQNPAHTTATNKSAIAVSMKEILTMTQGLSWADDCDFGQGCTGGETISHKDHTNKTGSGDFGHRIGIDLCITKPITGEEGQRRLSTSACGWSKRFASLNRIGLLTATRRWNTEGAEWSVKSQTSRTDRERTKGWKKRAEAVLRPI